MTYNVFAGTLNSTSTSTHMFHKPRSILITTVCGILNKFATKTTNFLRRLNNESVLP